MGRIKKEVMGGFEKAIMAFDNLVHPDHSVKPVEDVEHVPVEEEIMDRKKARPKKLPINKVPGKMRKMV